MSNYRKIQAIINQALTKCKKQIDYLEGLFKNKKLYDVTEKISSTYSKLLEKR